VLKSLKKLFFDPALQRRKAFLRSMTLFRDLRDRELGHLAQCLHARTYHAGEVLFVEGDIGRALFILETGKVELTRAGANGKMELVYAAQPGDFFGEMALLEQLPRTATATSVERSHLYLLYRSKLDGLLNHQPRIGASVMTHLAQLLSARLRQVSARSGA
jgi:CRP/FNR family transcriptional regulator, cyclic AMP receptor protein